MSLPRVGAAAAERGLMLARGSGKVEGVGIGRRKVRTRRRSAATVKFSQIKQDLLS